MTPTSVLNSKKLPLIRSRVSDTEILPVKGNYTFKQEKYARLFVLLSGSAEYELISTQEQSNKGHFRSNNLFFLDSTDSLIIKSDAQCQILIISFDLFEAVDFTTDLSFKEQFIVKYRDFRLMSECFSVTKIEERYPYFQSDLRNLILHCNSSPVDLDTLPYSLENVVYTLIRIQFSSLINIVNSINSVAFANDGIQFEVPLNFCVGDVKIVASNPAENPNSENLFIANAENFHIESPTGENETKTKFIADNNYAEYSLQTQSDFKFWLFPKEGSNFPDRNRSVGFITFPFRCNQTGKFKLSLTHIPTYQSIDYSFEITEPDTWTDIVIPVIKTISVNPVTPYLGKALQYIQDNYAEKITIQDIADYVKIHPSYLSAIFRKKLNQSVNSYINSHRINIAKQLLRNSDTSITDIALLTGFYDAQHFLKTFKKIAGQTPSEYRNNE